MRHRCVRCGNATIPLRDDENRDVRGLRICTTCRIAQQAVNHEIASFRAFLQDLRRRVQEIDRLAAEALIYTEPGGSQGILTRSGSEQHEKFLFKAEASGLEVLDITTFEDKARGFVRLVASRPSA